MIPTRRLPAHGPAVYRPPPPPATPPLQNIDLIKKTEAEISEEYLSNDRGMRMAGTDGDRAGMEWYYPIPTCPCMLGPAYPNSLRIAMVLQGRVASPFTANHPLMRER